MPRFLLYFTNCMALIALHMDTMSHWKMVTTVVGQGIHGAPRRAYRHTVFTTEANVHVCLGQ